jgi:flagellar secretion chaperone FliS
MSTDTIDAYLRTQVLTASPEQLRLLLLDGALRFATQGRDGLIRKDFEAVYSGFNQARDIVLELATSVKPEPDAELASRVRSVYLFIFQQLVTASFEKDAALATKAIELLEYERETWCMLMDQLAKERKNPSAAAQGDQPSILGTLSLQA